MVIHSCNPGTWKAGMKGLGVVQGQSGLHRKTLPLKNKKPKTKQQKSST